MVTCPDCDGAGTALGSSCAFCVGGGGWSSLAELTGDAVKREPGCACHWEVGDSPCPVHDEEPPSEAQS